jgi:hypothetical protein
MLGSSWVAPQLEASQEGFSSMKLVSYCFCEEFIRQWLYCPLLGPGPLISFVILYTEVRIPWKAATYTQNSRDTE